jgi:hypothetical protein
MRTELTYAVDAMARYNGAYNAAASHVADYYREGGLSHEYFRKVIGFMLAVEKIGMGRPDMVNPKMLKRIVKAMRRKMPRVHTEVSNWRLTYHDYMLGAYEARLLGHFAHAKTELRCARSIRERYL